MDKKRDIEEVIYKIGKANLIDRDFILPFVLALVDVNERVGNGNIRRELIDFLNYCEEEDGK